MTEKTFVKQLEKIFEQEGFFTKREVGVGYGVADLVVIKKDKLNQRRCAIRRDYGQFSKLLREDYFKILEQVPDQGAGRKPIALEDLIEKTHLSKSFLKYTILRTLEEKKYIKREGKNFYFKISGWMPIADEVIAIEAKMRNWKRGFIQANRYKSFADKVYLAVPVETAHLVDKKLLKKHHVGLIVFDAQANEKKTALPVKGHEPLNDYKRNLAIEFFWGRRTLRELALI
jgi:hypothetical protein